MIKNVAELLQQIADRHQAVADRHRIKHPVAIGSMYEGLTQDVLSRGIPPNADLRVVTGFIEGRNGRSKQIDCMVVLGPGEQQPFTQNWIYNVDQVVAVIEVKKSMTPKALSDGFENLASVAVLERATPVSRRIVEVIFRSITGRSPPDDLTKVDPVLAMFWHLAIVEASTPARILLGFHGYKTESGMRRALVNFLNNRINKKGYGPLAFPHLVVVRNTAAVKANGLPWGRRIEDDGRWAMVATTTAMSPVRALLEIIWCRLNYLQILSAELFGEDMELEPFTRLLDAKCVPNIGWEFTAYSANTRSSGKLVAGRWKPVELRGDVEPTLIGYLGKHGELDMDDLPVGCPPEDVARAVERLVAEGLVGAFADRPSVYSLLTDECHCVFLGDRVYAAENSTGRLTRWLEKQIQIKTGSPVGEGSASSER